MPALLDTFSVLPGPGVLVEGAIRSAAVIAIAAMAAATFRRSSAAWRHLVWTMALVGCALMPLATRAVPDLPLAALPAWEVPAPARSVSEPPAAAGLTAVSQLDARSTAGSQVTPAPASRHGERAGSAPARSIDWDDVLRVAPLVWLAGVVILLARHLAAWLLLSRVARRAMPLTAPRWQRALARNGSALGLGRLPAMRISSEVTVPIVCNAVRPVILLPAAALEWNDERCDSVLLHELAHVRRFDLITAQAAHLAVVMSWFHPLVWLAAARQRAEAERACDDQVLQAGSRASAYATDLLEIARAAGERHYDAAALAMARHSQLEGRLLAILDAKRPRRAGGRLAMSLALLIAAATVSVVAAARPASSQRATNSDMPSPPEPAAENPAELLAAKETQSSAAQSSATKPSTTKSSATKSSETKSSGTQSHWHASDDGDGEVRSGNWSYKDSRGSFKSKGSVRWNDALDDIESISTGGYIVIEDRRHGTRNEADFRNRGGRLEKTYKVNGVQRPWDDTARAWMAEFLIDVDRGSGMFVEERLPRLMSEGGPTRVLAEISEMSSDYGRSQYFSHLLANDLDAATLRKLVSQAGREIDSDYELARTLIAAASRQALDDAATRTAYLDAVNSLESDYEHARVLLVLVARRDLSPALASGTIVSAGRISSDYEQARVMIALVEKGHAGQPQQRDFIAGVRSISSDYEKSRVLRTLIEHGELAAENIGPLLDAGDTISSDFEHANVLVDLAETVAMAKADRTLFVTSAERLSSNYERSRALAALGKSQP